MFVDAYFDGRASTRLSCSASIPVQLAACDEVLLS